MAACSQCKGVASHPFLLADCKRPPSQSEALWAVIASNADILWVRHAIKRSVWRPQWLRWRLRGLSIPNTRYRRYLARKELSILRSSIGIFRAVRYWSRNNHLKARVACILHVMFADIFSMMQNLLGISNWLWTIFWTVCVCAVDLRSAVHCRPVHARFLPLSVDSILDADVTMRVLSVTYNIDLQYQKMSNIREHRICLGAIENLVWVYRRDLGDASSGRAFFNGVSQDIAIDTILTNRSRRNSPTNQSELEASTCNWRQTGEIA